MKRGSIVKKVFKNGTLLMEDWWICKIHNTITVNSPERTNTKTLEIEEVYGLRNNNGNLEYSLVFLKDKHYIEKGDVLYTHNI